MVEPREFYDSLAGDYHLMFGDWWASAAHQGEVLDRVLRGRGVAPGATLLDCTCGIGTQALPLARLGYRVSGSDLSASAVDRAQAEAAARGLGISWSVSDVRALSPGRFDVVLSGDNSLAHLRTDADLAAALSAIHRNVAPGGVFLASVRDYDRLAGQPGVMPVRHGDRIVGQAWTWTGDLVTFDLFILERRENGWDTTVRTTTSRAWRRRELSDAITAAGFTDLTWHEPADTGYHQPIVTCRA